MGNLTAVGPVPKGILDPPTGADYELMEAQLKAIYLARDRPGPSYSCQIRPTATPVINRGKR
jgi:hypothetical protein